MPTPDHLILAMLTAAPQHGYTILDAFRDPSRLGHIWDMSAAQVYAVLKRLERDGDIAGVTVETPTAPPRTEFRVTARGMARLRAWLDEANPSSSIRRVRVDFMSRLYAARLLGEPVDALVTRQQRACARERAAVAEALRAAETDISRMALSLQLAQLDAVLSWMSSLVDGAPAGDRL